MKLAPLVILSGPSGSGKSTLIRRVLLPPALPYRLSVSATTRDQRKNEQPGVDYYYWDRAKFEAELAAGAFLEWAEVYGNYYGTLRNEVEPYREQGTGVILDVDSQGAANVKAKCPDVVRILLRASSMAEYERRLRLRHTEDEPTIQRRLAGAQRELDRAADYEYTIINDDLEQAVADFRTILEQLLTETDNHAG